MKILLRRFSPSGKGKRDPRITLAEGYYLRRAVTELTSNMGVAIYSHEPGACSEDASVWRFGYSSLPTWSPKLI